MQRSAGDVHFPWGAIGMQEKWEAEPPICDHEHWREERMTY